MLLYYYSFTSFKLIGAINPNPFLTTTHYHVVLAAFFVMDTSSLNSHMLFVCCNKTLLILSRERTCKSEKYKVMKEENVTHAQMSEKLLMLVMNKIDGVMSSCFCVERMTRYTHDK